MRRSSDEVADEPRTLPWSRSGSLSPSPAWCGGTNRLLEPRGGDPDPLEAFEVSGDHLAALIAVTEQEDGRACGGDAVGVLSDEKLVVALVGRLAKDDRVQADMHSGRA